MSEYTTIDEYIAAQPPAIQPLLLQLRHAIRNAAPHAQERIGYRMPAFYLNNKPLAYFAAHKSHIGFYPIPSGIAAFSAELRQFHTTKGGVQFPYNKALPLDLITKIVQYRVQEMLN